MGDYTYDYSYDDLNRLTGADFRSGGVNPTSFDLQGLSYDRNGNIQGLRRFGGESELIDSLDYDYSGNRLMHLVDAVVDTASGGGETPLVQTIYEESLASPWIDASWSASVDYASTDIASGGTTSIRVDQQAWGAFSVRSGSWSGGVPIEADIYDEITFDVYAPTQEVTIAVLLEGDGQSYSYQYWGTVPAGQWVPVTMNLDALNPNDNYFLRIDIQETSGAARTFYIDNFRLSGTQADTTQVLATRGAQSANFEHDDSGNLIYQSGVFSGIGYEWRGLPTRFDLAGGGQVRAAYNTEGQRILKTTPGGWEFYVRDGDRIMAVLDSSGVQRMNLYGNGLIGKLEAQGGAIDTTSPRRYYLKDHLGSIRAVADGQGNMLESYDYYPFGMLMAARSDTIQTTRELFTGQERDPRLGLDYFGARYYDPAIGRWVSVDPRADEYVAWSPYTYTLNDPINFFDPDGLYPYTIHIRSFAPPGAFIGFGGFSDDRRGFSTSFGVTSRIKQNFTIDPSARTYSGGRPQSDPTYWGSYSRTASPTGGISTPSFGRNYFGSATAALTSKFEGSNPFFYGFAPNIEVASAISLTENLEEGKLFVSLDLSSKFFPATESFITDEVGTKIFLAGIAAFGDPGDLITGSRREGAIVDLIININNMGEFQSVIFGGNTFSIEEFNELGTSRSAGPYRRN